MCSSSETALYRYAGEAFSGIAPQGRVRAVAENYTQNYTQPTPGFDCHMSEQISTVSPATCSFLAYERTQVSQLAETCHFLLCLPPAVNTHACAAVLPVRVAPRGPPGQTPPPRVSLCCRGVHLRRGCAHYLGATGAEVNLILPTPSVRYQCCCLRTMWLPCHYGKKPCISGDAGAVWTWRFK